MNAFSKSVLIMNTTVGRSGVDQTALMLARGLRKRNWAVSYLAPAMPSFQEELSACGVNLYTQTNYRWWYPISVSEQSLDASLPGLKADILDSIKLVRKIRPSVIIANTTTSLTPHFVGKILGIPVITHMHAGLVSNIYRNKSFSLEKTLLGTVSEGDIVVPSKSLANHIYSILPEAMPKVHIVNNGVNLNNFKKKKRMPNVGFLDIVCLGHLNTNKNQEFLVDVALELKKLKSTRVRFIVAGPDDGDYGTSLMRRIVADGVEDFFEIRPSTESPSTLLSTAWAYVNCSITETFPVSVLEALASGLPIFATPNEGNLEILNECEAGIISSSPADMALKISKLVDSESYDRLSVEARKLAQEKYSEELFVRNFESLLSSAATTNRRPDFGNALLLGTEFSKALRDYSNPGALNVAVLVPDREQIAVQLLADEALNFLEQKGLISWSFITPEAKDNEIDCFDLLLIIRSHDASALELLSRFHERKKPVIFETDDNYFGLKSNLSTVEHRKWENKELKILAQNADQIIVYSEEAFQTFRKINACTEKIEPFQIFPDEGNVSRSKSSRNQTIGYVGSLNREIDFQFLTPTLKAILDERPDVSLHFAGFVPPELENHPRVIVSSFDANYHQFIKRLRSWHWTVGIAPLADTQFNRSKTNNKYREYSAAEIPGVYSAIPPYSGSVTDGETGLFATNDPKSWKQKLLELIDSPALQRKIVKTANSDVRRKFKLEDHSRKKFSILVSSLEKYEYRLNRMAPNPKESAGNTSFEEISGHYIENVTHWEGTESQLLLSLNIHPLNQAPIGIELVLNGKIIYSQAHPVIGGLLEIRCQGLLEPGTLLIRAFSPVGDVPLRLHREVSLRKPQDITILEPKSV